MNVYELIEALRKEAPKLGMTEEELFTKLHGILGDAQKVDIFGLTKRLSAQQMRMEVNRDEMNKKMAKGARKTNGALEFPI